MKRINWNEIRSRRLVSTLFMQVKIYVEYATSAQKERSFFNAHAHTLLSLTQHFSIKTLATPQLLSPSFKPETLLSHFFLCLSLFLSISNSPKQQQWLPVTTDPAMYPGLIRPVWTRRSDTAGSGRDRGAATPPRSATPGRKHASGSAPSTPRRRPRVRMMRRRVISAARRPRRIFPHTRNLPTWRVAPARAARLSPRLRRRLTSLSPHSLPPARSSSPSPAPWFSSTRSRVRRFALSIFP